MDSKTLFSPSRLAVIAAVCFSLNVFFIGLFLGHYLYRIHSQPPRPYPYSLVYHISQRLPAADAAILQRNFAVRRQDFVALQRKIGRAMDSIHKVLKIEPLDKQKLSEQIALYNELQGQLQSLVAATFEQSLEQMSPAGRLAFASPNSTENNR